MDNSIIALIPAAGRGTRLLPLPFPKELFPIGFQDYLKDSQVVRRPKVVSQYLVENLHNAGVNDFHFIISENKSEILNYYGNGSRFGISISYLFQENPKGMVDAINLAYSWIGDKTIIFGMPDTIIEPINVFQRLLDSHKTNQNDVTLGLFKTINPSKFGMVEFDSSLNVLNTIDKPEFTHLDWMWGCACWGGKFTKLIYNLTNAHNKPDKELVLGDVFNCAIENKLRVGAVQFHDGHYIDIGTPSELNEALIKYHL